jgi:hypothetical protein
VQVGKYVARPRTEQATGQRSCHGWKQIKVAGTRGRQPTGWLVSQPERGDENACGEDPCVGDLDPSCGNRQSYTFPDTTTTHAVKIW